MTNQHYLAKYDKFINSIRKLGNRTLKYAEHHHIIPRCMQGTDDSGNIIRLRLREHFICHWMLYRANPGHLGLASAFLQMVNKNPRTKKPCDFKINSRVYERLKIHVYTLLSEQQTDKVYVTSAAGEQLCLSSAEYAAQDELKFHTTGKIYVFDSITDTWVYIDTVEYHSNKDRYLTRFSVAKYKYLDTAQDQIILMTKQHATELNSQKPGRDHRRYKQIIKSQVTCRDSHGNLQSIPLDQYDPVVHQHIRKGTVQVLDTQTNTQCTLTRAQYDQDPQRYLTSTKGKVLAMDTITSQPVLIDKALFDGIRYVGQTKNLTTVLDKHTGQYVQISRDQAKAQPDRYAGPCTGKINVINKHTGIRSQITKAEFDPVTYLHLGFRKYLFQCQHVTSGKLKLINIYEWHLVKNNYIILDTNKYAQLRDML